MRKYPKSVEGKPHAEGHGTIRKLMKPLKRSKLDLVIALMKDFMSRDLKSRDFKKQHLNLIA